MAEDGRDRYLDAIGIAIGLMIVIALAIIVLSALNAPTLRPDPPVTEWRLERVNETHVRIVHAGGDPVETDRLSVIVGRYERRANWSGVVFTGDAGIVRARSGEAIQLVWNGGRGDRVQLARWDPSTAASERDPFAGLG